MKTREAKAVRTSQLCYACRANETQNRHMGEHVTPYSRDNDDLRRSRERTREI